MDHCSKRGIQALQLQPGLNFIGSTNENKHKCDKCDSLIAMLDGIRIKYNRQHETKSPQCSTCTRNESTVKPNPDNREDTHTFLAVASRNGVCNAKTMQHQQSRKHCIGLATNQSPDTNLAVLKQLKFTTNKINHTKPI